MIAARVGFRARGLAQHVVGIGVAFCFHLGGTGHRGLDGFAQNELRPHFLHRAAHGGADHRLTQSFDRAAQMANGTRLFVLEHLARQHQRPCGGVDQRRRAFAQMAGPVRWRDLVFDQRVDGRGIGHP